MDNGDWFGFWYCVVGIVCYIIIRIKNKIDFQEALIKELRATLAEEDE